MKIIEDENIIFKRPDFLVGSYRDSESLPNTKDFKLQKVNECTSPTRIELVFRTPDGGQERTGWLEATEKHDPDIERRLKGYKKEIEEKLLHSTLEEILSHDFLFLDAEFTN